MLFSSLLSSTKIGRWSVGPSFLQFFDPAKSAPQGSHASVTAEERVRHFDIPQFGYVRAELFFAQGFVVFVLFASNFCDMAAHRHAWESDNDDDDDDENAPIAVAPPHGS